MKVEIVYGRVKPPVEKILLEVNPLELLHLLAMSRRSATDDKNAWKEYSDSIGLDIARMLRSAALDAGLLS